MVNTSTFRVFNSYKAVILDENQEDYVGLYIFFEIWDVRIADLLE